MDPGKTEPARVPMPRVSHRALATNPAIIDNILMKYKGRPETYQVEYNLAPGGAAFDPPNEVVEYLKDGSGTFLFDTSKEREETANAEANAKVKVKVKRELVAYGECLGDEELRQVFMRRFYDRYGNANRRHTRNLLNGVETTQNEEVPFDVMVTCGANNAFVTTALAITDVDDEVIVPSPYYFSHCMTLQHLNVKIRAVPIEMSHNSNHCHTLGSGQASPEPQDDYHPLLAAEMTQAETTFLKHVRAAINEKTRAVVITSPSNPTGYMFSSALMVALQHVCILHNLWMIVDMAYEDFVFDEKEKTKPKESNEIQEETKLPPLLPRLSSNMIILFTMSKSYSMAGFRIGFLVFPTADPTLMHCLLKSQDMNITHPPVLTQKLALHVLSNTPPSFVQTERLHLQQVRDVIYTEIKTLKCMQCVERPHGAFYFWIPLPIGVCDLDAVHYFVVKHGLLVVPGSSFGAPTGQVADAEHVGYLRVCYSSVRLEQAKDAAKKIKDAIQQLYLLPDVSAIRGCYDKERLDV